MAGPAGGVRPTILHPPGLLRYRVPALTGDRWRQDPLLSIIGSRQYEQWQNLRQLDPSSTEVALRVEKFCANICKAMQQEWLSPEERQQAEAETERRRQQEAQVKRRLDAAAARKLRRDEDERSRQEAEDKRRLAEAEAKKHRQDEEKRSLEEELRGRRAARLEEERILAKEQRRKRLEQEPQQPVQPWLLPLIGAVAASLPIPAFLAWLVARHGSPPASIYFYFFAVVMIYASYGGAAGILIRRFGIPKAAAIPVIPALLLLLVVGAFLGWTRSLVEWLVPVSLGTSGWIDGLVLFAPAAMCAWLAFWLHTLRVRKTTVMRSRADT